jgi:hypothetical protein
MTCVELQESLVESENGTSAAQQAHLRNCPQCSTLVEDLLVIVCAAGELRSAHEPGLHLWNSIESTLRREGIIKPQHRSGSLLPSLASSWAWARWSVPVAAALLISLGIALRPHAPSPKVVHSELVSRPAVADASLDASIAGLNDDDLLAEVAQQGPALQAQYTENLRHVNEYIQDARNTVAADPNDEDARRALMEAYQEKAMLFELALDRSLP